jgi:hypothetical protein
MLFLYRPRQTWMPYSLPRNRTQQGNYNRHLQDQFEATHRVPPAVPAPAPTGAPFVAELRELGEMHRTGVLTDAEFEAAKAKLLAS